ncbi:hypothetical protein AVEN_42180-1 [Araneus ventricosus]|uniref:Uncharacterized protein n=1 Tax=Araneus ventricosus TaxID=182803 RepID=A0A4Y2AYQ1_ARAVE|nr:hypothetical protein AVEN_42180-1 [Araneus ventricosus]
MLAGRDIQNLSLESKGLQHLSQSGANWSSHLALGHLRQRPDIALSKFSSRMSIGWRPSCPEAADFPAAYCDENILLQYKTAETAYENRTPGFRWRRHSAAFERVQYRLRPAEYKDFFVVDVFIVVVVTKGGRREEEVVTCSINNPLSGLDCVQL